MQMEKIDYETGASHILDSDKWDTALADLIQEEMLSDGDAAQYINTLARKYIAGDADTKENIDTVLIHICGWGMDSLISKLGIIASRDIQPGEELTMKYGPPNACPNAPPCHCRSKECLGYMPHEN